MAQERIHIIRKCRSCGTRKLRPVISLGSQYVSDFLPEGRQAGLKAPLNLMECQTCGLVQLEHTVNRDLIYRKYWYRSGTDAIMRKVLKDVVEDTFTRLSNKDVNGIWLDIGSNDGTLLEQVSQDWDRIGFEPAKNLIDDMAYQKPTFPNHAMLLVNDFFSAKKYWPITNKKANAISACAMFYDLEDPNKFLEDVKEILNEEGVFVVQQNYLPTMVERSTYDNICHEHLEYYSLATMMSLLKRHGLEVFDVELNDVNGGSFRTYIGHKDAYPIGESVARLSAYEKQVMTGTAFQVFRERAEQGRHKLLEFITRERAKGNLTYGYGAGNRGNTILQYCGLTPDLLPKIAEHNPEKWGRRTPGSNISICSKDTMRKANPAYLLILAYFYLNGFLEAERSYLEKGGAFIVPVPTPRIIRVENGETKTYPL